MLLFDCYCSIILPTRCSLRLVAACLLFLHVVAIAMQLLHLLHDIMHLHVCINCVRLCGICMCSLIFICVCVCVLLCLHMCVSTNFVFLLFRHLFLYIAPQEGTRAKINENSVYPLSSHGTFFPAALRCLGVACVVLGPQCCARL